MQVYGDKRMSKNKNTADKTDGITGQQVNMDSLILSTEINIVTSQ